MDIKLYRCFNTDQRVSMQIYADQLEQELNAQNFRVASHQPTSQWERFSQSRLIMRYLRYVDYPRRVKGLTADIHHVIDHGYAHLLPRLGKGRSVVTVHDLIPLLAHRGVIESNHRQHRPRLSEYSLSFAKNFDHVVAPSQSTAVDVQQYLNVPENKISVISPIVGHVFSPQSEVAAEDFASRHGLRSDASWVLLSGQEFYKNHQTSLEVVKLLRAQGMDVQVLKTGISSTEFNQQVVAHGLTDCVHQIFLKDVAEVAEAYAFVDCLLFPSFYEGFGMPVVEALACGTRVVASNRGSLPELAGGLVPTIDPHDIDSLVIALAEQLELSKTKQDAFGFQSDKLTQKYRPDSIVPTWHELYRSLAS